MNREKLIKNSFRSEEILNKLNNRQIFWLNLGDLLVPDLTQKIFNKRLAKIEDAIDYYADPVMCEMGREIISSRKTNK